MRTKFTIASAIGTARIPTHGSCRPVTSTSTSSPAGDEVEVEVTGRHDPCVGIRAVPIAEAMVNLVLMDHFLRNQAQCGTINQSTPFKK